MDPDKAAVDRYSYGQMSSVTLETEFFFFNIFKWKTRNDGNAMIALLAIDRDMFISEFTNFRIRELAIATFSFLQAKNVWLMVHQEFSDEVAAMTDRIYIPGCNLQFHRFASLPQPRQVGSL
jgi:hypothetical protein